MEINICFLKRNILFPLYLTFILLTLQSEIMANENNQDNLTSRISEENSVELNSKEYPHRMVSFGVIPDSYGTFVVEHLDNPFRINNKKINSYRISLLSKPSIFFLIYRYDRFSLK